MTFNDNDPLSTLKTMLQSIADDPAFWDLTSQLYKNSLDSLRRAGFTREEAITIISRQGCGAKSITS